MLLREKRKYGTILPLYTIEQALLVDLQQQATISTLLSFNKTDLK